MSQGTGAQNVKVKNICAIKCISEWENVAGYKSQVYTVPSTSHRRPFEHISHRLGQEESHSHFGVRILWIEEHSWFLSQTSVPGSWRQPSPVTTLLRTLSPWYSKPSLHNLTTELGSCYFFTRERLHTVYPTGRQILAFRYGFYYKWISWLKIQS